MLSLLIGDSTYKVVFHHSPYVDCKMVRRGNNPDGSERWLCEYVPPSKRPRRYTNCTITKDEKLVASSYATCAHQDQFNRSKGREQALTEALAIAFPEATGFTAAQARSLRRAIWSAYWARTRKTK